MRKWIATSVLALVATSVWADGGVTFNSITEGDTNGITYRRIGNPVREAAVASYMAQTAQVPGSVLGDLAVNVRAHAARGMPGVALLDYDNDGDLDIYVTNGPDTPNSLYANQFSQTGVVTFVDVAAAAGVEATGPEGSGVCFGDIDNDGDDDLYVITVAAPNFLFENQGDGTFVDITLAANAGAPERYSTACSFADFNGDALLDVVIANTYNSWNQRGPFQAGPHYDNFEHNVVLMNTGGNVFVDNSAASGIENVSNMDQPGTTGAALSWVVMTYDYDLDGDVDILFGDNQGPMPVDGDPAEERGYLRLYSNDGSGIFTEVTRDVELDVIGGWMGLDAGDFNCDGNMDFFGTNIGWASGEPSRPLMARNNGTFHDVGVGDLKMTPFGWGVSIFDYDNDGDSDAIYHGGFGIITGWLAGNGGVVLQNTGDCSGVLDWDEAAVVKDHRVRMVNGMAAGDLNMDGFEDIVTVSAENITPAIYLAMTGPPFFVNPTTGSPFEATARFEASHAPFPPGSWTRLAPTDDNGVVIPPPLGNLVIELNSGDNGNHWVDLTLLGTHGLLDGGTSNRNGIGATVFFTPDGGKTSARPIVGGSSFASQDALSAGFGLGTADSGVAVVQWPNGVQNRLVVAAGERLTLPEIPCDFSTSFRNLAAYYSCVKQATNDAVAAGLMTPELRERYVNSALAPCDPDSGVNLCLGGGRFKVDVGFVGYDGVLGQAQVIPYGEKSGIFWFFNEDTIEMNMKLIDACDFNDAFWVFAAASTDVEYALNVTDMQTGEVRTYANPLGNSASAVTDTSAFLTCP